MGEEDAVGEEVGDLVVARHLGPLVPGQAAPGGLGQIAEGSGEGVTQLLGAAASGEMDDADVATSALHERANGGAVVAPDDEVALPVAESGSGFDGHGTLVDQPPGATKRGERSCGRRRRRRSGRPVRSRLVNALLRPPLEPL